VGISEISLRSNRIADAGGVSRGDCQRVKCGRTYGRGIWEVSRGRVQRGWRAGRTPSERAGGRGLVNPAGARLRPPQTAQPEFELLLLSTFSSFDLYLLSRSGLSKDEAPRLPAIRTDGRYLFGGNQAGHKANAPSSRTPSRLPLRQSSNLNGASGFSTCSPDFRRRD
jgi:hypothetical protein